MKSGFSDSAGVSEAMVPAGSVGFDEDISATGHVVIEVFGPDGELKEREVTHNLITQAGDEYYGERAAGIAGAPGQVVGMKLGTGSTAVAKTGAGAALVTYLSGSHKAIDGGYPTSGLNGSSRRITWKTSWTAGTVNGSALREVIITNESSLTNATSAEADTICRALFGPMTLGSLDTISITWSHDLLGA